MENRPLRTHMGYKPNSKPERHADIAPELLTQTLTEQYVMNRAMTHWNGPKNISFNNFASRLRTYTNWPQGMNPAPDSLSAAGFSIR
jgi:hypothetical protein